MRIALLTSEAFPFAKTGGLADVSGALPKALGEHGADARLLLPLYDQIDRKLVNGKAIEDIRVEWRGQIHLTRAWESDAAGAPAYLIEAPEFFAREGIYGHKDDHVRFAFFSRAALMRQAVPKNDPEYQAYAICLQHGSKPRDHLPA